jgi:poly(3-hydroxybutyrate) depolymerase
MIYKIYQAQADLMYPARQLARLGAGLARAMDMGEFTPAPLRQFGAVCSMLADGGLTHHRPDYGFRSARMGNDVVAVTEESRLETPFGTLLRFRKDIPVVQPRVLVVAPMSGHFATLLRGTAQTLLADHDVYITDWHNARDIGLRHGGFGFGEFIDHFITFLQVLGPGVHVVGVCQPCVAVLAAVAIMAEDSDPAQPRSMTLMAGPIDARVSPTEVNRLATSRPIDWFERNLIGIVPLRYPGALRRVYQGFCAACRFYEHEPGPPRQSPDRSFLPSRQWRRRKGGIDPRVL